MKNPFRKKKNELSNRLAAVEYELSAEASTLTPVVDEEMYRSIKNSRERRADLDAAKATYDWEAVEGHDGIEVKVERPLVINVRTGEAGSRTIRQYRAKTEVVSDAVDEAVTEFTNKYLVPSEFEDRL
ncbi:hypothetical protein ACFUN8_18590 [Streptomyces sp. NPDC057307]|uniref:hypothetical protein n=1 Tax=Streptomyces sp. NPDC057307 TaxID=3346096 RepID=UPI00362C5799